MSPQVPTGRLGENRELWSRHERAAVDREADSREQAVILPPDWARRMDRLGTL